MERMQCEQNADVETVSRDLSPYTLQHKITVYIALRFSPQSYTDGMVCRPLRNAEEWSDDPNSDVPEAPPDPLRDFNRKGSAILLIEK